MAAAEDDTGLLGAAPAAARRIAVVAHRGAPRLARENTLPSLRAALTAGTDWVEVDVRLARCGTPVLLHDATLQRLWGLPRPVTDLDAAELAALPGPAGAGVPTLREGLTLCAEAGVTVMVDVPGPAEGDASLALVRELGLLDTCVFAGHRAALARVRAASPTARIALSWESFLPPRRSVLARIRPQYLNVEHHRLTRPLVSFARRHDLAVSVWTVDRPKRMARLARLGADVIITNDPVALLGMLTCTHPRGAGNCTPSHPPT
ncbi:glycerophosphodiester phosphodiesterase [Streptacidiphilus jiangxiensis]|uniref:Glycerophosphoryl diester phosphodiesterase n=1 Tax=Streptacidiphilus jiangxiensis TaxID=235985 RepID=A0A1H7WPW7_STRJI|nr:glycerophosphodiester phosphodiesterase [Streptacidiphilus jiangxiensis]SEM23542.1 glycerophosphoryl diester phosphodiesterase [Streptacidiphilus jiangxiensis]